MLCILFHRTVLSDSCIISITIEIYLTSLFDVAVPNLSDSEWQTKVLESDVPVLVEFWAPWCGPCRMIHPIVDQLAKDFAGKFKFYKINTDESPNTANRYGIRSVPTVIIFKGGEKKDSIIGAVPRETLEKTIERFLVE